MSRNTLTDAELTSRVASAVNAEQPGDDVRLARILVKVDTARRTARRVDRRVPILGRFVLATAIGAVSVVGILIAPAVVPGLHTSGTQYRPGDTTKPVPGIAYAQVEQAMGNIRTLSWTQTTTTNNKGVESMKVTRYWARLGDKPAYLIHEISDGAKSNKVLYDVLTDTRGKIYYNQKMGDYKTIPLSEAYHGEDRIGSLQQYIKIFITNPAEQTFQPPKLLTKKKGGGPDDYIEVRNMDGAFSHRPWKKSSETNADGKTLTVFRSRITHDIGRIVRESLRRRGKTAELARFKIKDGTLLDTFDTTVWVDPDTRLMVRQETVTNFGSAKLRIRTTREYTGYNEELPRGVFDWSANDDDPAARTE